MPAVSELFFFALFPPAGTADTIASLAPRPVRAEKLHITLLVPEHPVQIDALLRAGVSVSCKPFEILLDHAEGGFGGSRCYILSPAHAALAPLHELHRRLREAVVREEQGLLRESFRPHLTLARGVADERVESIEPIRWRAESFRLMRSVRNEGRYVVEAEWTLPPE